MVVVPTRVSVLVSVRLVACFDDVLELIGRSSALCVLALVPAGRTEVEAHHTEADTAEAALSRAVL